MKEITKTSIILKKEKEFISSKMGSELMAMDMDSGNYIHFNEIGSLIWEYLDNFNTITDIAEKLVQEYDISLEDCEQAILKLIKHLKSLDLISIK